MEEQTYHGNHIYNSGLNLEESLINASKIYKALDLMDGKYVVREQNRPQLDYIKAIDHRSRQFHHQKQMSNINEGVEFSTERQEKEEQNKDKSSIEINEKVVDINSIENFPLRHPEHYLIKRKEKIMWKKVLRYMKQNPNVLMDLVSDSNKYRNESISNMQFDDASPYVATQTETVTIPIQNL